MKLSLDEEVRRKLIILMLVGLIVILCFSLYALYDYYFKYERSDDEIEYEYEPYVEFYLFEMNTSFVTGEEFNVSVGVANFLGTDMNLTVHCSEGNRTFELTLLDKQVKTVEVPLVLSEERTVVFELRDRDGKTLSRMERTFTPSG